VHRSHVDDGLSLKDRSSYGQKLKTEAHTLGKLAAKGEKKVAMLLGFWASKW
jgi:hypothetical protein